jgi:hypothetical protein
MRIGDCKKQLSAKVEVHPSPDEPSIKLPYRTLLNVMSLV